MRISKPEMYMRIAHIVAQRSTCININVGAVIVKDGRVVSLGYNGSTPSASHCDYHFRKIFEEIKYAYDGNFEKYLDSEEFKKLHHDWATEHEVHAEQNAILFAARKGIPTEDTQIYVTYTPCIVCAKTIIQSGIKEVYYNRIYTRDVREVMKMFEGSKVKFEEVRLL